MNISKRLRRYAWWGKAEYNWLIIRYKESTRLHMIGLNMKCNEVRLTEVCKSCNVGNTNANCPTVNNESSAITYAIPPYSIFDLVSYKNHIGEEVVCISADGSDILEVGKIYTISDQFNDYFQYIRLKEFKDYPNVFFGRDRFKKLKAIYGGEEYTFSVSIPKD